MFGLFKSATPKRVQIDGLENTLVVTGKETILNAALRQGIPFPHSCRVGGCGNCKCQLKQGKVKELTESAYVLSEAELEQGYILACQSIPQTDIQIAVADLNTGKPGVSPRSIRGVVIAKRQLTHDIAALQIELEQPLQYAAGQYALLSIPGLINEGRSYSFANSAPSLGSTLLEFYIRQIPGGTLSSWAQGNVVDTPVQLTGPFGHFYLRPSERPMLCIAGGSGLAPIKALLESARTQPQARPVTLLFGARRQRDLYCLEELQELQSQWPGGDFEFIPVLSEEPADSSWSGARGLVTDLLPTLATPQHQVYMCGPAPMLDAAESRLQQLGLAADQIFSDRFLDRSTNLKLATSA